MSKTKNSQYYVAPRYTGGSPGMVDRETALRIAEEERASWGHHMDGTYGPGSKEVAEKGGLHGIVEFRKERAGGWDVHDLITGKQCRREDVKASKLRARDTILRIRTGRYSGSALDNGITKVTSVTNDGERGSVYVRGVFGIGPFEFSKNDLLFVERTLHEQFIMEHEFAPDGQDADHCMYCGKAWAEGNHTGQEER